MCQLLPSVARGIDLIPYELTFFSLCHVVLAFFWPWSSSNPDAPESKSSPLQVGVLEEHHHATSHLVLRGSGLLALDALDHDIQESG